MTGLKNKNGALQRDKLKMGIGKNERMMEAQRDREGDRMLTMHRETDMKRLERERQSLTDVQWRRMEQGESVRRLVHCCFIVDATPACLPLHTRYLSPPFSLTHLLTHHRFSAFRHLKCVGDLTCQSHV